MCLLDAVVAHDARRTVCAVADRRGGLFAAADGSVPAYLALEWMAQCAAAHAALRAREDAAPALRGMLLGTRSLALGMARVAAADALRVEAHHLGGERGLVVFSGSVRARGGSEIASGRIHLHAEPVDPPAAERARTGR